MGCFLACFGSSKDRKRHRHRHKVQHRYQRNAGFKPVQSAVSLAQNNPEIPTDPVSDILVKPEEQLNLSPRKKATFDSNVTTYEHVSVEESTKFSTEREDCGKRKEKEESLPKQSQSQSCSDDSSITSSSGSYPSNHRYQNGRENDDELDYGESDVEDDDDDDDKDEDDGVLEYGDTYEDDVGNLGSRSKISTTQGTEPFAEEVDSPVMISSSPEKEVKPNPNVRYRSAYVHSVLNPVENLTQWKALKAKRTPPLKQQKENHTLSQEPQISFGSERSFKELSFSFRAKSDNQSRKSNQEIAVDASLSNWLGSSESTPINKPSTIGLGPITLEKNSISVGSNSPKSFEDRPILGALSVAEIKQFSASSSPRRSRSRSPDEMPIIGTVGTYWNHNSSEDSGSASSFKGIPNTTTKYGEDKRVNWHSTPFEARMERALKGGAVAI